MENWQPVLGYEDHYEASDLGKLRRVTSSQGTHAGKICKPGQVRGHLGQTRGYLNYTLSVEGITKTFIAHRLIWRAFNGPVPEGMHLNHKNGNKSDNRLSNLETCTPQQNYRHALDVLGHKPTQPPGLQIGSKNTNAAVSDDDVREIRRLYSDGGVSQQSLADRYGIHQAHLSRIIRRVSWPHIT